MLLMPLGDFFGVEQSERGCRSSRRWWPRSSRIEVPSPLSGQSEGECTEFNYVERVEGIRRHKIVVRRGGRRVEAAFV